MEIYITSRIVEEINNLEALLKIFDSLNQEGKKPELTIPIYEEIKV